MKYVEICQGGATSDNEPIDTNLLVAAGLMTVSGPFFLNNDPQTTSGAYTALITGGAFSWRSNLNRLPTREQLPCESILQRFKDDQSVASGENHHLRLAVGGDISHERAIVSLCETCVPHLYFGHPSGCAGLWVKEPMLYGADCDQSAKPAYLASAGLLAAGLFGGGLLISSADDCGSNQPGCSGYEGLIEYLTGYALMGGGAVVAASTAVDGGKQGG